MPLAIKCRQALIELEETRRNVRRFWNLIYAVSVAFALFTIFLVGSLVWGNDPSKAVAALATIASGGGLLFVIRQKNQAEKRHDTAKSALRRDCGEAAEQLRSLGPDVELGLPEEAVDLIAGSSTQGSTTADEGAER
ncbi:TRADD-N-associated membrane domain-containing protein [Ornithinimicrobium cryptoxanthini]|uniref:Cyanobacterial TRADD-N associated 2 transmembrane domain-containing protein n=1 Tax=Ornithinimicrobium cryptoxanthini TaxID=2934161 RepID=A0ABY4YFG0_9MICO|nr:hypothetical protein [Ornithinimicrobium cryptoxanthini]USQ75349.1 hypothetical protein NF557_12045 [Ornithinimicrobium cryptoxanthini]